MPGRSGMVCRYLSTLDLKLSMHFSGVLERSGSSLSSSGKELKSIGPTTENDELRMVAAHPCLRLVLGTISNLLLGQ